MSTLPEIEAAVDALPPEKQQELLVYLAARLRANSASNPDPRRFTAEEINEWIASDEAEMQRFRSSQPK